MNHNRRLLLVVAFVILGVLQIACLCVAPRSERSESRWGSSSRSTSNWSGRFTNESEIKTSTIEVKSEMTQMTLDAEFTLNGGAATLILTDPQGQVRLEKRIDSPARVDETYEYEPVVGEWTLEIIFEEASGNYRVQWKANN